MPVNKQFKSSETADSWLSVSCLARGKVEIYVDAEGGCPSTFGVELDPEDIPALIAELRRVAKLAKEARDG